MASKILSKDDFFSKLLSFPETDKYWIACSGGLDSSVLLHLFYLNKENIKQTIEVVYVDHRLQKQSSEWGDFCYELCQQYELPFTRLEIKEEYQEGLGIEAWAREKRYALLANKLSRNDMLVTGHHLDDQVETFFLYALRGSGPRGLVAMPVVREFAKGVQIRPLLNYTRSQLQSYASENKLVWQNDPSNYNNRHDRNYLRNSVLPIIEARWPAYRDTTARLVQHQQELKSMLDEIAENDLNKAKVKNPTAINLDSVYELSPARKKNLLAFWLKKLNLNLPASCHLNQIVSDVIESGKDKVPCVNWNDIEVRRYRNKLYAFNSLAEHDNSKRYEWNIKQAFKSLGESLVSGSTRGNGIANQYLKNNVVEIRYRQGGEKIKPENQLITKSVKHLLQERGVLPWYRDRIPLVYINNELALIPGICVSESFCAKDNEASWNITWTGYEKAIEQ